MKSHIEAIKEVLARAMNKYFNNVDICITKLPKNKAILSLQLYCICCYVVIHYRNA